MLFLSHTPKYPLAACVESIAYFEGFLPEHDREILIPDGAMHLIVDPGESAKHLYDAPRAASGTGFRHSWISGLQGKPITIEAQRNSSLLVVRFHPGGGLPFLGFAAEALANRVEAFDSVLGQAALSLRDRVLEATTPEARIASAEAWLLERARGVPSVAAPMRFMLGRLAADANLKIADLAEMTGYCERQVRNLFWHWVGMSPKQYARVLRFQGVLGHLTAGGGAAAHDPFLAAGTIPEPDWKDVALQYGYADQSHLNAEFRALAGVTPGHYVSAYRGLANYLPIRLAGATDPG